MAIVRELFVSIGIVPNEQQFKRAEKRIQEFRAGFFLLGASVAAVGAVIGKSLGEAATAADHLDDLSQKTGVGTTALQELAYAAEQSGSSAEALNGSFAPLARQMAEAASGGKEAATAFKGLGVNIKNADGSLRPMEDVLIASADGIAALTSDAARSAAAMKIFGRSGTELVPLLKNGSQAIANLRAEAQELGFVMDEGTVKAFAGFEDTSKRVKNVALGLSRAFAKGLLPNFRSLFERLLAVNRASGQTVRSRLEDWGRRLGEVFARVDQVIVSLITAARGVFTIFSSMPAVFQGAIAVLGLLALAFAVPAIEMALIIALIVALLDEFRAFNDGAESVFDDLFAMMPEWVNNILAFVVAVFAPFLDPALWQNVINYWQDSLFKLFAVVQEIWGVISTFFGDAVFSFVDGIKQAIDGVVEAWNKVKKLVGGAVTGGTFGIGGTIDQAISGGMFGGGAAPTAGIANTNTGGNTINAPATNNITINAAPGMSGNDVAQAVSSRMNSDQTEQYRAAYSGFGGQ